MPRQTSRTMPLHSNYHDTHRMQLFFSGSFQSHKHGTTLATSGLMNPTPFRHSLFKTGCFQQPGLSWRECSDVQLEFTAITEESSNGIALVTINNMLLAYHLPRSSLAECRNRDQPSPGHSPLPNIAYRSVQLKY
jgi:hypothetical protein